MRVRIFYMPFDPSAFGPTMGPTPQLETGEYEGVKRVSIENEGVGVTLMLHRPRGNVGIPYIRIHHWEEENAEAAS